MESASLEGGQAGSSLAILEGKEEPAGERQTEGQIDECQAMKRQPFDQRPVPESLLSENVGQVVEEELVEWIPVEDGPGALQEEKDVEEALIMLQPVVALFDGIKSQAEAVSELEDPPSMQSIIRASDFSPPGRVVNANKRTASQAFERTLSDSPPPNKIVAISRSDMPTETALEQYSEIYKDFQLLASRDAKLVEGLKAISLKEVQLQSTVNELHTRIKEKDLNIARHESEDKYMREKVRSLQSLNSQNIARRKDPGKRSPDPRAREISLSAPGDNHLHEHKAVQCANIKARIESLQATHQETVVELQGNIKEKEEAMARQASRYVSLAVTALEEVYTTNESLQATVQQVGTLIPPSHYMNLKNSQLQADIFKHGDDKRILESRHMELQAKTESLEAAHQETVVELQGNIKEKEEAMARQASRYVSLAVTALEEVYATNESLQATVRQVGTLIPPSHYMNLKNSQLQADMFKHGDDKRVLESHHMELQAKMESLEAAHQETVVELQGNIKEKEEAMARQASRYVSLAVTALEEVYATNESLQATVRQVGTLIPPSHYMNLKNSQLQADMFKHGDDKRVLESRHMELQAKMESLEAAHQETVVELHGSIKEAERMVETVLQLRHTIHEKQAENASFRNDLQGVRTANEALLRINERELGLKQTEWQSEMNELTKSFGSQIDAKNQEMIICQDKLKNAEIQRDQLVNRYNDLKERLNTIENNIRHSHTERPVTQKEWNNAFETVEPQVWEAMVKLRNELSSKLAKAQSNMKQMRKHIQDLQNQKTEVQQVGESIIKPDINHTMSAERPQRLDLHIPTQCSNQSGPAINSHGFWQNTMFTFQMGARADDHEPLDSRTEGHPATDAVNILNLQSNSSIPILPGVGMETDTASTRSGSSVSSAVPSGMSHFSGSATDREGADIAGGKMKYNKNSLTARNFCAKDWCEAHKGGTVVQFRHHWNTLSPLEREKYERISQNAKVAKSNKPELNEEVAVSVKNRTRSGAESVP
ncbi:hypothetical protein IW262DRAFT_1297381 [Armillaria fumosa]|nr:hypothetical protein IW262DRAFT_1297381 [Armillaria fumosa]